MNNIESNMEFSLFELLLLGKIRKTKGIMKKRWRK